MIYWSDAFEVQPFGRNVGITVHRPSVSPIAARIWIPGDIAGRQIPPDLRDRLNGALAGKPSTLYVLGSFTWNKRFGRPELTPHSVHHAWVEPGSPSFRTGP
jgi:hypothetical protein